MQRGVTLVEMTVVILVLLILVGISVVSTGAYREWAVGSEASQSLREIYTAQRSYLADNPTINVSAVTAADIIPYLSSGEAALPVIEDKDGAVLAVNLTVSPPVVTNDPSGSTTDGLWDLGD
ncbi:MAG: prepilin-type N-terminal cleavage/methylation domain-containing protein [Bacteroidota bacterium]